MSVSVTKQCPLCGCHLCIQESNRTHYTCNCPNCGIFSITGQAIEAAGNEAWKLAPYVFEQNSRNLHPFLYSSQKNINLDNQKGSVGVDHVIESFPKSIVERLDRALINLASATRYLGCLIKIPSETANPLLLAQNGAEALFVLQHFGNEGYVSQRVTSLPAEISLTGKGMGRVSDLQRNLFGPQHMQVFVAMSFDKNLSCAWTSGLKLGIEDCGYKALRVDTKEHNDKICDVIVAEIRNSKFLVADFTLHRGGVYFEAGLMMGIGRPVIFSCRNDELGKAHFDTRQYNHIGWDGPDDLREKLKRRIQATINF